MADTNPFADPNFGANLAAANPFSDPNFGAPRGMVRKLGTAALKGAGSEVTGVIGKSLALAASVPFMAADALRGGGSTAAQDWAFKNLVDPTKRAAEYFAPSPEEAASVPLSVAHGLGAMAVDLPIIAATGGKIGAPEAVASGARTLTAAERAFHGLQAMTPVAVAHGVSQAETASSQGVDLPTAYKSGAVSGLTTATMGMVPLSMTGNLATRAATGAVSGMATGELGRRAQNAVLSDYPVLQSEFTGKDVAVNAATGALLGSVLGPRAARPKNAPEAPVEPPKLLGQEPNQPYGPKISFPDGSVGTPADVDAYLKTMVKPDGTPDEAAQMAARAKLYNINIGETPGAKGADEALAEAAARENAPPVETVPARSQAHAEDMAMIRDAGETPTGDPAADSLRVKMLQENPPASVSERGLTQSSGLASDHVNSQLSDALLEAQRQKAIADGKAATDAAFELKAKADEAERNRHLEAIWNITKARELAEAAEQGRVPNNLPDLPLPHNDFLNTLKGVIPEGKRPPNGLIQSIAKAVNGKGTVQEQLDAIAALRDSKKSNSVGYEYLGELHTKMSEGRIKPDENALETKTLEAVKTEAQRPEEPTNSVEIGTKLGEAHAIPVKAADAVDVRQEAGNGERVGEGNAKPEEAAKPQGDGEEAPVENFTGIDAEKNAQAVERAAARKRLQEAADRLDATVADFHARMRAGEKLSASEQARFDEAGELRAVLQKETNIPSLKPTPEHLHNLADLADSTATPEAYAKSADDRLNMKDANWIPNASGLKTTDPNTRSLGMIGLLASTNKLSDVLQNFKVNGSQPWVKELAGKLHDLGLDATLQLTGPHPDVKMGHQGEYNYSYNHVKIFRGGETEHVVLHEAVHAATAARVARAQRIDKPRTQEEAKLKKSYDELERIRAEAMNKAGVDSPYGLTDVHELLAEANSNPEFQAFLTQHGGDRSLWTRLVDAVRGMLGLQPGARNSLEKVMSLQGEFFSNDKYESPQQVALKFDSSPKGAAEVTDNTLSYMSKAADKIAEKADLGRVSTAVFRTLLPWKTVQYIADRVHAVPEMVQHGLDAAVRTYEQAYQNRQLASNYAEGTATKFAAGVQSMLRGLKDEGRARSLNQAMSEVSVGSSIGGFDPTKNFADNLALRPDLSAANKGYIDEIYRKFKALPADAQKAVVEGAQVNRKSYVLDNATIISNLMNHLTGNVIKLEAELQQMDPADANRARMEARVLSARQEANLAVTHAPGLDFMAKDVQNARNGDTSKHIDGASFILDQRIKAAFAAAKTLPEGSVLKAQLGELEGKYLNQIDNPYYHAGRSGDYFVKVGFKNMDDATWEKMKGALAGTNKVLGDYTNQDHAFFRVETADQSAGLRRKLEQAGGDKIDMTQSANGKLTEAGQLSNNAGISQALRSVLATLHDTVEENPGISPEQSAAMREALTRKFLSMLPETSTRLATIKRMGVPGYDGDFLGSFAKRASGGIRDTANIYSMRAYSEAFKGMAASVESLARSGNTDIQARAQMVRDEITTRYNDSMKPIDNTHVNLINSLGHSFYLALAPAFFIRTMAQPFHRGVPYMGGRYGYVVSSKEIGRATGTAMKIMDATIKQGWSEEGMRGVLNAEMSFKNMGLTPSEEAFVQELHDRGVLDLGQSRQLQRMAIGGSPRMQDVVRFTSMTAQYAEMTNRLAVGLAAFRLAEKGRTGVTQKGTAANTDYAAKAIKYVMDDFDPNNTARAIGKHGVAGKVTPLMTAFMNYNLQTMQQIARTVHDGMFNRDPSPEGVQRSKEAKRELAGLMATTSLISGAMGLPFVSAFAGVYNSLMDTIDPDNPGDIRMSARNALATIFGKEGGDLLSHGIGAAVGVDTSSFGLQNLLPGSEFLASRRLLADRWKDTSQQLLGPALNAGLDITQAIGKFTDGQYVKGIEQALPSGLKGVYKAGEMVARGYTDAKGNPIGLEATPWDIAIQATGIRPANKADQAEAANYFHTDQMRLAHRRQILADEFYKAHLSGDAGNKQEVLAAITEFNKANPMQPIRDLGAIVRQKEIEKRVAVLSGTGVAAGIRKMPLLQQQLQFVNNGAMPQY